MMNAIEWHKMLESIPTPVFVVEEDMRVLHFNQAAGGMLGKDKTIALGSRLGEALACSMRITETQNGCGLAAICNNCSIQRSVSAAFQGQKIERRKVTIAVSRGSQIRFKPLLASTAPIDYGEKKAALVFLEDISELEALKGLVPICPKCKCIRNDKEYWRGVEDYLLGNPDSAHMHSLCPQCTEEAAKNVQAAFSRLEARNSTSQPPEMKAQIPPQP